MTHVRTPPPLHQARPAVLTAVGERAHYVVLDGDGWQLRRSLWGASAVLSELVAGPAYALRTMAHRERAAPDGWLDHADAGVLVDRGRRVLLFFGAHRQALPLDLRAALSAVLRRLWPGWTIRWAYAGTSDLRAYVGQPADTAITEAPTGSGTAGWYKAPWWSDAVGTLVTVRHAAGDVLIHPLDTVRPPVWQGPALVGRMPPGVRELSISSWPVSGVHLDLGRRSVGLWTAGTLAGLRSGWFDAVWSGWDVTFWEDRLDAQLAGCAGAVRTPPVRLPAGAVRLANLLADAWAEPRDAPQLRWLHGLEPAIGPYAMEGVTAHARAELPLVPSDSERRTVFATLRDIAATS
jgi:hypothetical protein